MHDVSGPKGDNGRPGLPGKEGKWHECNISKGAPILTRYIFLTGPPGKPGIYILPDLTSGSTLDAY